MTRIRLIYTDLIMLKDNHLNTHYSILIFPVTCLLVPYSRFEVQGSKILIFIFLIPGSWFLSPELNFYLLPFAFLLFPFTLSFILYPLSLFRSHIPSCFLIQLNFIWCHSAGNPCPASG